MTAGSTLARQVRNLAVMALFLLTVLAACTSEVDVAPTSTVPTPEQASVTGSAPEDETAPTATATPGSVDSGVSTPSEPSEVDARAEIQAMLECL